MKAVCWNGTHKVSVENVPDPKILNEHYEVFKHQEDDCLKVVLTP